MKHKPPIDPKKIKHEINFYSKLLKLRARRSGAELETSKGSYNK